MKSSSAAPGSGRAWLYLAPALIVLCAFTYLPVALALLASFFDISITSETWSFIGIGNYQRAVSDPSVQNAALNTVWYCLLTVIPSITFGLLLAVAIDGMRRVRVLTRTLLFLPMTANLVAMSIVFSWIFAYRGGFANTVLALVGVGPLNFLGDSSTALPTVAAVGAWRATSLNMVVYAASLTTVPQTIHDAAAADGVRGWTKLRKVLWPMLRPATVFVTIITFVQAIQVFDAVAVMTEGGPLGATESLLFLVWELGFQVFRLGYASAIAFVMLVAIILLGLARAKSLTRGGAT